MTQSYNPYGQESQEQQQYKQQLGLKKMLYKYQHENNQLKTQIKALTERLTDIMNKDKEKYAQKTVKKSSKEHQSKDPQQFRIQLLRQQMKRLYTEIQKTNGQIKSNKDEINQFQLQKCTKLQNQINLEVKEFVNIKSKLEKLEQMTHMKRYSQQTASLNTSSLRINTHNDKLRSIINQLEQTKKNIRQLQKSRNNNNRSEIKKHSYVVDLKKNTRKIQKGNVGEEILPQKKKQKGLWHLQYTQENYQIIKQELKQLKKQKQRIIQSLKNENILLSKKFTQLTEKLNQQMSHSIQLPEITKSITPILGQINREQRYSIKSPKKQKPSSLDKSTYLDVGPRQFTRNNDKNYVPKMSRRIQWQSSYSRNGVQWDDAHLRSPIVGMNLWFDKYLVGIQFLHVKVQSSQHLHLITKSISPIQYRLSTGDYLQNIILFHLEGRVVGLQLLSKNGRVDTFGANNKNNKNIRRFDFQIKKPQKPVYSLGKFKIVGNVSEINKIAFEII